MHQPRLPGGGGDGRELARQAGRRFAPGQPQGIAQGRDLSRLQLDRALRKPADRIAERLLAQLDPAGRFGALHQNEEQAFGFGRRRDGRENSFHSGNLVG